MIKAIPIDDETPCLDTLSMMPEEHCPEVQILDKCNSAREGLTAIEKLKPSYKTRYPLRQGHILTLRSGSQYGNDVHGYKN